MPTRNILCIALLLCFSLGNFGCSSNQTIKDAWQGTKDFWYSNVSVPASIDYDDTGDLSAYEQSLAKNMLGIDAQLTRLEKVMNNADRLPTQQWIQGLFAQFPWIDGFSGVREDGKIIGEAPGPPMKPLDFAPLLLEDTQQNFRALRANVQDTPMGPEVFLAAPLYDAHTFLGVVSVYFDMRALVKFAEDPANIVIFSPQAVLWAGKFDIASTPMAGIAWDKVTFQESSGTVSNANGKFYWTMRYLANQPIIFAVPMQGTFTEADNSLTGPTFSSAFVASDPFILKEPTAATEAEAQPEQDAVAAEAETQAPAVAQEPLPDPEVIVLSPAPAPRQQVQRRPVMLDVPPVHVPEPTPAPAVVMPSPIHRAPAEPATVQTPSPIHPAPTQSDTEGSANEESGQDETQESTSSEQETPAESPEPSGEDFSRPSPFGPQ